MSLESRGVAMRVMVPADYDALLALLTSTPGVTLRDADSRDATGRYLARNPGLSLVAEDAGTIVGCVMAGHDGRRGYLNHLIVLPAYRHRGVASALVDRCLDGLEREGIAKVHIDVLVDNAAAVAFWEKRGWWLRTDIHRYSFARSGGGSNA